MGVGAPHGLDLAVQKPAHGPLLAGGLGVEVHQGQVGAAAAQQAVGHFKGVVQVGVQLRPAHQIQNGDAQPLAGVDAHAPARHPPGVVGGAENARLLVQIVPDLQPVPGVIAQGDHVGPGLQNAPGLGGGDAHAGGVLPVDHHKVGLRLLPQPVQTAGENVQAALAHHVANGQYIQKHSCVLLQIIPPAERG